MAKGLSYADAVRLLGGRESRAVAALDRLVGGLLLVASAAGAGFALSLFDPKSELAKLSGDLVSGLTQRLRGVSRLGRMSDLPPLMRSSCSRRTSRRCGRLTCRSTPKS